jgi:hypothetical protein
MAAEEEALPTDPSVNVSASKFAAAKQLQARYSQYQFKVDGSKEAEVH